MIGSLNDWTTGQTTVDGTGDRTFFSSSHDDIDIGFPEQFPKTIYPKTETIAITKPPFSLVVTFPDLLNRLTHTTDLDDEVAKLSPLKPFLRLADGLPSSEAEPPANIGPRADEQEHQECADATEQVDCGPAVSEAGFNAGTALQEESMQCF